MTHEQFEKIRTLQDKKEAVCHFVLDEAQELDVKGGIGALTVGQRTVWAVETLFGEVCNGGFDQYFFNQARIAFAAHDGLKRCGLGAYVRLFEKVLALWPKGKVPRSQREYEHAWGEVRDLPGTVKALSSIESSFYKMMDRDENRFRTALFEYIIANEKQFVAKKR